MKKYFFIVLVFISASVVAQPLKLNLTTGSKYEVVTTLKFTSIASIMGQSMESKVDNETIENFHVKSIAANNNELSGEIKKVIFSMNMMGQDMNYNSETSDGKGEIAQALGKKINKPFPVLYNDNGSVLNKDIVKAAQPDDVVPGMTPPSDKVSLIDEIFIGKEIKDGVTWNDSTNNTEDKMKVITKGTYKVLTVQNGLASILYEGTLQQSGVVEQMGMEMNTTGTSNVKREIMLDTKTGLIIQSNTTTTGTNNIEVAGMSIPVEISTTTTKKIKLLPPQ